MAYKQKNYFEFRDSLAKGDPDKVIKGKHFDEEFGAIEKAFGEVKVDVNAEDVIGLDTLLKDKADQSDLDQEIQDRIDGDDGLQAQIDDFEPYDDGPIREELSGLDDKIDKEIGDRGEADKLLQGQIDKLDEDKADLSDLNQEINDRKDGDNAINKRIDELVTDDLADVNSANAKKDDFLIHNGTQWVAKEFHIETELTYMGGISVVSDPAPTANNGDLYINNEKGKVGSSWIGIADEQINEAVAVGWSEKNGRWYMLGDIASAAVMSVGAGTGIDVDNNTDPSEPVVSIDRTETDKWYAPIDSVIDDGAVDGEVLIWNQGAGDWTPDDTLVIQGGNATFSGTVNADAIASSVFYRLNNSGITFVGPGLIPTDGNGDPKDADKDLGRNDFRFKDAYFSGTVNCGSVESTGIIKASKGANEFAAVSTIAGVQLSAYDRPNAQYTQMQFRANDYKFSTAGSTNNAFLIGADDNATFYGHVGIGMKPLRSTAKEQLAEWKSRFDARLKAEPKADKKAVTLEITDNAFEVLPAESKLAEWMQSRAAGDALQVVGRGSFSGNVRCATLIAENSNSTASLQIKGDSENLYGSPNGRIWRDQGGGFQLTGTSIRPLNGIGVEEDALLDIGRTAYRFKDAYFSGTVNATTINGKVTDVPDHVKNITPTQIAEWDAGTGNGEGGGATTDGRITDDQIIHWDQAYSWGDHSQANYQPAGNYVTAGTSYTKNESDNKYELKGTAYSKSESDVKYQLKGDYASGGHTHSEYELKGTAYTKSESDANFDHYFRWNLMVGDIGQPIHRVTSDETILIEGAGGTTVSRNGGTITISSDAGGGGLPDGDWHCNGNISASGNITAYKPSDERLKDDIAPMPVGLIDGINPVTFKYKDSGRSSAGVIAQQLQACGLDDWVNEAPNGDLGVDYEALIGVLLAEVIDLKNRVKELEA